MLCLGQCWNREEETLFTAPRKKHVGALIAIAWLCSLTITTTSTAVESDWERWGNHNPAETFVPDHKGFSTILQKFGVKSEGEFLVAYGILKGPGTDYLASYTAYLQRLPVSKMNRNEQLAYWLNLYNASVMHAIATSKRIPKRMNDLRGTPGAPGKLWKKEMFTIEGHQLSLEDIEMNILAQHWQSSSGDPMWVYGLTWGAVGSPPLTQEAFSGAEVDKQLTGIAKAFVNHSGNVRVKGNNLIVSSLYQWHKPLFGSSDDAIISHLAPLAKSKLKKELDKIDTISNFYFDWHTNLYEPEKLPSMPEATVRPEFGVD